MAAETARVASPAARGCRRIGQEPSSSSDCLDLTAKLVMPMSVTAKRVAVAFVMAVIVAGLTEVAMVFAVPLWAAVNETVATTTMGYQGIPGTRSHSSRVPVATRHALALAQVIALVGLAILLMASQLLSAY